MTDHYVEHEKSMAEWAAFRNQVTTPKLVAEMLVHRNAGPRLDALRSGMATQVQIQALISDDVPEVRAQALMSLKQPTPAQIAGALADESVKVRSAALSCQVTEAQAVAAFEDKQTRYEAIRTGKLPQHLLDIAMSDVSHPVREAAEEAGGKKSLRGTLKNVLYRTRCIVGF